MAGLVPAISRQFRQAGNTGGVSFLRTLGIAQRMPIPSTLATAFAKLAIDVPCYEHPPLRTVEDAHRYWDALSGAQVKNLFLKDAGGQLWLMVVPGDPRMDTKAMAALIGSKRAVARRAWCRARRGDPVGGDERHNAARAHGAACRPDAGGIVACAPAGQHRDDPDRTGGAASLHDLKARCTGAG